MTDTFAYFVGSLIGKHKIAPKVSPKKSLEGCIGGAIAGTAIASIYYYNVITSNINIFALIGLFATVALANFQLDSFQVYVDFIPINIRTTWRFILQ